MDPDLLINLTVLGCLTIGSLVAGLWQRKRATQIHAVRALGFEGRFEPDGPHLRGVFDGLEVLVEPRSDGRVERSSLAVRLTHPHLGGPFTLTLGEAHDAPRRPTTGDAVFDAQAHLLTLKPLETYARLDAAQRVALLQLMQWGSLRLSQGRLDLLMAPDGPGTPPLAERLRALVEVAQRLRGAVVPDPLPGLLERMQQGSLGERVATGRLLRRELGALPEVRAGVAALLQSPDAPVRWAALQALGTPADFDALALDANAPADLRLRAWLAGDQPEVPGNLPLEGASSAEVLQAALAAGNSRALHLIPLIEDPAVVEGLPASPARTAALARLRAQRAQRAGQLSLAPTNEAGGLRLADEAGRLALADGSKAP